MQCHCRQTKHSCMRQVWRKERKRGKRPQAWVQKHTLASPPQPEEQPAAARRRRPPPVLKVNQIAWTSDNARVRPKAAVPWTMHQHSIGLLLHCSCYLRPFTKIQLICHSQTGRRTLNKLSVPTPLRLLLLYVDLR